VEAARTREQTIGGIGGRIRLARNHDAAVRDRGGGDVEGFQELVGLGKSRGQEFRVEAARVAWQKNVGRQLLEKKNAKSVVWWNDKHDKHDL
jgi:hypothetical protein